MLYLLCLLPCGDAFALVKKSPADSQIRRGENRYGNALFSCAAVYVLTYFVCGLSKWTSDPFWGSTENLRHILIQDSMNFGEPIFGSDLMPAYLQAGYPNLLFGAMGVGALITETAGLIFVIHRGARPLLLVLFCLLHLGIYFGQKVPFADLMVLPLAFVPVDELRKRLFDTKSLAEGPPMQSVLGRRKRAAPAAFFSALILCGWYFGWEVFPISSVWNMYGYVARRPHITYDILTAVDRSGRKFRPDLGDQIPLLRDWQELIPFPESRDPGEMRKLQTTLLTYAQLHNSNVPAERHILSFELDRYIWNVTQDPASPTRGRQVDSIVLGTSSAP
jgi:hypothetical protein